MKSFRFSSKWFAHHILIVVLLFIQGCSRDDDIETANGDGGTSASETIGSGGGEIHIDGYSISIPPGAFSKDYEIEVSISDREDPFRDQEVTNLYKVSGIPEDFSEPIKISLKYDGMLEDESFIATGVEQDLEETDTTVILFDLLECDDSSGFLVGKLLPPGQDGYKSGLRNMKGNDGIPKIFFKGVTRGKVITNKPSQPPFTIYFPAYAEMDHLLDYLEINYLVFDTWMEPSSFENFKIPEKVVVLDCRGYYDPLYRNMVFRYVDKRKSKYGEAYFYYAFLNTLFNETKMNTEIGHAFFEALQVFIYKNKSIDWISNAASRWIEEKFYAPLGETDDYIPECVDNHELVPFYSWGSYSGHAMAPVVKFLVEEYGEKIVVEYHKKMLTDKSVYKALSEVISDPLEKWMPEFFQHYMEGNIYGVTGDKFVAGIHSKDQHDLPAQGAPQYFEDDYHDLDAKIYRFNTKDISFKDNAKVGFKVESWELEEKYLKVLIFSLNRDNNKIEFISDKISNLSIVYDIQGLEEQNKDIIAVVVNSYKDINNENNQSEVQLKVELAESVQLTYKKFSVALRNVNVEYKYHDGSVQKFEDRTLAVNMPYPIYGKFNGNEFEAEWNYKDGSQQISGSVLAYVEEKKDGLFLSSYNITSVVELSDFKETRQMGGYEIPIKKRGNYEHSGKVEGFQIDISGLDRELLIWTVDFINDDKSLRDDSYKLNDIEFTNESELEVRFTDPL